MRAAVPAYLGSSFNEAPPGHRHRLYFAGWEEGSWALTRNERRQSVEAARGLPKPCVEQLERIVGRQDARAASLPETFSPVAVTEAPFVTGMGMEHPLENGFAFLDPYGLPYLPGSSVKGVLRRAAEELAHFEPGSGWTLAAVWWLFGFDHTSAYLADANHGSAIVVDERQRWCEAYLRRVGPELEALRRAVSLGCSERRVLERLEEDPAAVLHGLPGSADRRAIHLAGALELWDVLPEPPDGRLHVDVMNPHFDHYYQHGQAPTDDKEPKPIFFLALPVGCRFRFHMRLHPKADVPAELRTGWRPLAEAAFEHAIGTLGFGAKTSSGYGRMVRDREAETKRDAARAAEQERVRKALEAEQEAARRAEEKRRIEALGPVDKLLHELETCIENRVFTIQAEELEKLSGDDQRRLAEGLKAAYGRLGKWAGRQTDKQKKKVARIKSILGEQ